MAWLPLLTLLLSVSRICSSSAAENSSPSRSLLTMVSILSPSDLMLEDHDYVAPSSSDHRSPCPALNTLANHGYLNRNGQNVSVEALATAAERLYGIQSSTVRDLARNIFTKLLGRSSEPAFFDFRELYVENGREQLAPFDETIFEGLLEHSRIQNGQSALPTNLTMTNIVHYQVHRIWEHRTNKPESSFGYMLSSSMEERIHMAQTLTGAMWAFGNDPYGDVVPANWWRSFLVENRVPPGFQPRQDQGLPVLDPSANRYYQSKFLPIQLQLEAAMTLPLPDNNSSSALVPSATSYRTEALDVVLEDLRLFMKDYGNGKVVAHVPDRPLERFFEQIAANVVPLTPQFHAGTKGAKSTFIKDKDQRYPLLLPPSTQEEAKTTNQPDLDEVFDRLFLRREFIPETHVNANMLLVSFANWFLDEFFRTEPNTDGALHRFPTPNSGDVVKAPAGGISLKTVYGTDYSRERALRTFQHGMLKTGHDGGLPSLPQIREEHENFTMACGYNRGDTACHDDETFYATGHERFNFHPGHLVYSELFLREHNDLAKTLHQQNPQWDDERIYQTARLTLTHVLAKIILNEYISNALSTAQEFVEIGYDPNRWRCLGYDKTKMQVSLEFNHLYRWHGLIAEHLDFGNDGLVSFHEFLWKPETLEDHGGASVLAEALHRTRMGALQARNTPFYLREITKSTIADERAQSLQGYNDYREYFTLPRLESFEDLGADPEVTEALKEMYDSVDDMELFVGAMVEQRFTPGTTFMSELLLVSIASQAFAGILNADFIKDPNLYSEESLTQFGLDYIQSTSLKSLLEKHYGMDLPCGTPLLLGGHASCELVETPSEFAMTNLVDFVGLDFVLDPFYEEDFFYHIFMVFLVLVIVILAAFFATHLFLIHSQAFYKGLEPFEKFRFCYGVVNIAALLLTAIPYSYFAILLLFGSDFVGVAEANYLPLFSFLLIHGILYVVEACARLVYSPEGWLLLFHHFMWFLMILLAGLTKSVFLFKVDFVLDVMVSFEAGLFVALQLRRHSSNLQLRIQAILWGGGIFFVTRILQSIILVYLLVESAPRMTTSPGDKGLFAIAILASVVLSALQFYTLTIYYRFYREAIVESKQLPKTLSDHTATENVLGISSSAASSCGEEGSSGVGRDARMIRRLPSHDSSVADMSTNGMEDTAEA